MVPWLWLLIAAGIIGWFWWRRSRRSNTPPSPPAADPVEAPVAEPMIDAAPQESFQ
jgi:hypothetical protein